MLRILLVSGYYLPGFKAGGPIRTLSNLIDWLGREFEFYVLAADRDLGEQYSYATIQHGRWEMVGNARVRYLSPAEMRWWQWRHWLHEVDYDILYLNSFFSQTTWGVMVLRRLELIPAKPIILAPRGEFSLGALGLKSAKKRLYIQLVKQLGLYAGLTWQASSDFERSDIERALNSAANTIVVAPNLPSPLIDNTSLHASSLGKIRGHASVVFLSRIARKKNLDFALRVLANVRGEVDLNIVGPLEDHDYWRYCETLIRQLPSNIRARYSGEVRPEQVSSVFAQHHLFLFPTRGENFGHVILEALRSGCPVLISDQTPWRGLRKEEIGWDLSLSEPNEFCKALEEFVAMDEVEYSRWSQAARRYGEQFAADTALLEANRKLFLSSVKQCPT